MDIADVNRLPTEMAAARIAYGEDSLQFGDLYLPDGKGPHKIVVILHGGCWASQYADLTLMDPMASALRKAGFAVWNLEYRRIGDPGGGWPNTFLDVANGINHLREIASKYPLDLQYIVVIGHSAGGHLALWVAAQDQLPINSDIYAGPPLPLSGVVSLAGIVDPTTYLVREGSSCGTHVAELMGGLPEDQPERYQESSPLWLSPLGVPQVLITGTKDKIVPISHVRPYYVKAKAEGDKVQQIDVEGAGHFEVIAPGSIAWPAIVNSIKRLSGKKAK